MKNDKKVFSVIEKILTFATDFEITVREHNAPKY